MSNQPAAGKPDWPPLGRRPARHRRRPDRLPGGLARLVVTVNELAAAWSRARAEGCVS